MKTYLSNAIVTLGLSIASSTLADEYRCACESETPPAVQATMRLPDLVARIERGVVVVVVADGRGVIASQGSGFFLDLVHVVTNRHVLDGERAEIVLHDGRRFPVESVVADDAANDLALLRVAIPQDAGHAPLELADATPRKGDDVLVLGAPRGLDFSLSRGVVSAIRPIDGMSTSPLIQIDAAISPGSSGGPVVNALGKVIGVASFTHAEGQSLNFAQSIAHVAALSPGEARSLAALRSEDARRELTHAAEQCRSGRFREALATLERLARTRAEDVDVWLWYAIALGRCGFAAEAIAATERVIALRRDP